jgi:hypothetical protein
LAGWAGGGRLLQLGVILTLPLLYVGVVVATTGLWMLTAAEPNRTEPAGDRNLRLAARAFVVLGFCGLIAVSVAMVVAIFGRQYQLFDDWLYADAFIIAAHGVYLLGLLASWSYLATFAQRMNNDQLLKQCKRMRTFWLAAGVGVILIALIANGGNLLYNSLRIHRWWFGPVLGGAVTTIIFSLWFTTLRFTSRWRQAM